MEECARRSVATATRSRSVLFHGDQHVYSRCELRDTNAGTREKGEPETRGERERLEEKKREKEKEREEKYKRERIRLCVHIRTSYRACNKNGTRVAISVGHIGDHPYKISSE